MPCSAIDCRACCTAGLLSTVPKKLAAAQQMRGDLQLLYVCRLGPYVITSHRSAHTSVGLHVGHDALRLDDPAGMRARPAHCPGRTNREQLLFDGRWGVSVKTGAYQELVQRYIHMMQPRHLQ